MQRRGERLSGKQNEGSPQSLKDISHRFQSFLFFLNCKISTLKIFSRTKSDITQSVSKVGRSFTLSRSKSIASARDRRKLSSSYGLLPFLGKEKQEKEEREEKERLKEALTVEAGQRIRLERELVVARQEGRQQNEELAELREEQREMMGTETRQDYSHLKTKYLCFVSLKMFPDHHHDCLSFNC